MWARTVESLYGTGGLLIGSSASVEAAGHTTDMEQSVVLMEGASDRCIGFLPGGTGTLEAAGDDTLKGGLLTEAKGDCIAFVPSELPSETETLEAAVGGIDDTSKSGLLVEAKSNCIVFVPSEAGTLQVAGDGAEDASGNAPGLLTEAKSGHVVFVPDKGGVADSKL